MGKKLAVCWLLKVCLSGVGVLLVAEADLGAASALTGGGEVEGTVGEYNPESGTVLLLLPRTRSFALLGGLGCVWLRTSPGLHSFSLAC